MTMKTDPKADALRAEYLQVCEQLMNHVQSMRNYAMKPGNAWLARAELSKITGLTAEVEGLIDQIKQADEEV